MEAGGCVQQGRELLELVRIQVKENLIQHHRLRTLAGGFEHEVGSVLAQQADSMVDEVKKTVLTRNSFSPLVKKVVGIDASIVKGANYAQLVNLTLLQESNVEVSLSRLQNVVAAWCLGNKEPIPYSPKPWDL